jgi:hypothetical protein
VVSLVQLRRNEQVAPHWPVAVSQQLDAKQDPLSAQTISAP